MTTTAPARRVALAAGIAHTGNGTYRGFTIRETAGSTATVRIHAGTTATGNLLATISLTANGSQQHDVDPGVWFDAGVFITIVSGTVEGSVFIA